MNIVINGYESTAKTSVFPGGEEFVQLPKGLPLEAARIEVLADLRSSNEVMQLLMLTDALREHYRFDKDVEYVLNLSYLPYARQDRICAKGEAFSLRVMANLINSLGYDKVFIDDCHSEVGLALINNVVHSTQLQCIVGKPETHNLARKCDVIVAPDAGAAKKAQEIATYYGKPLVQCLKTRVGERIEIQVLGDIKGKRALVVDDICDGGGTFLALAKALGGANRPIELNLYVTHGLFSKGKQVLLDAYDKVEAYNEW
jgi:ribose-phosphate pyrophosphokinase